MTIQQALDQKVWAVIGATDKTEKFGYKIYKCLKDHGYEVYPVNPNIAEIEGDTCYSSLSVLPVVPAVVDFVVPESAGLAALDECKELGIPTPYNEYTYHMIKALEEKNDGLFDYKGKDETPTYSK